MRRGETIERQDRELFERERRLAHRRARDEGRVCACEGPHRPGWCLADDPAEIERERAMA